MATGIPAGNRLRSGHAALALVFVSLLFLSILPAIEQRRIAYRLDQISTLIDPARIALSDMQVDLALEAAGTRGFLLNGDRRYAQSHQKARAHRKRVYAQLETLMARMDPEIQSRFAQIGRDLATADVLLDRLYAGTISRDQYMAYLAEQHDRFTSVTTASGELHYRMREAASANRNDIQQLHRAGTRLTLAGVALALAALIAVARLSARNQALAEGERLARREMEKAHDEADRRRVEAERLGASRAGLMRGFSHDVKNALGAADGYLFMLDQGVTGTLEAGQRHGVNKARRCVGMALQLIEDLLDLARAQAGEVAINREGVNLTAIIASVVDDYRAQATSQGLFLKMEVADRARWIHSDGRRISQILGNLVGNAIKYTTSGGVTVRLDERTADDGVFVVIDVVDTGRGIALHDQRVIFEEFRRLEQTIAEKGTGVGLAISQQVARALGGRISVESTPGQGSTFTLWLPKESPVV